MKVGDMTIRSGDSFLKEERAIERVKVRAIAQSVRREKVRGER